MTSAPGHPAEPTPGANPEAQSAPIANGAGPASAAPGSGRKFSPILAAAIDLLLIAAFVDIGRRSHAEAGTASGFLTTLWPFAAGATVGWLLARAWRHPLRLRFTGLIIVGGTVAVGMLLRGLSSQPVAPAFAVVTTIVLTIFLLGWRLIAGVIVRRRAARTR